jgi:hypothetical protein
LVGGADNPSPDRFPLTVGYLIGAGFMIVGGLVAWFFGVNAEGQSLEDIADPLSVAKPSETNPDAIVGGPGSAPQTDTEQDPAPSGRAPVAISSEPVSDGASGIDATNGD